MKVRESSNRAPFARGAALLLLVAAGCGDDVPASQLVSVTEIAPGGADCAQRGGVSIQQGADKNKNGKLDAAEVTSTTVVCEGPQTDPKVVVNTTTLAEGSTACPLGGSQVDSGLDNGDGGGMAGDGILQAGEIDSTVYVCNGTPTGNYDLTKPAGAVGTARISLAGGNATVNGNGGNAGSATLFPNPPLNTFLVSPSAVVVYDTGTVDTSHTVPTLTVDLGTNGETYSSSTTIATTLGTTNGTVYIDTSVSPARFVRYVAATTSYSTVTGIRINSGVTLTIGTTTAINVTLPKDLDIQGTLQTQPDGAGVRPSLTISARNVNIASTGAVLTSSPSGVNSGTAGSLSVSAAGTLVNRGSLNASGGVYTGPNPDTASDGGNVTLAAEALYNVGAITTAGGSFPTTGAPDNAGGKGGGVLLVGTVALVNEGAITTTGGFGRAGGGGGNVSLVFQATPGARLEGTIISTGAIGARGGDCYTTASAGGTGGSVTILSGFGARIRHSAPIIASGGSTSSVASSTCGGGNGGAIRVIAAQPDELWDTTSMVDVAGNLDTSGGNGSEGGGAGGALQISATRTRGALVRLLGYAGFDVNGGNAASSGASSFVGGNGGLIRHSMSDTYAMWSSFSPAQLHIHAPVKLQGGDGAGSAGTGGSGGSLQVTHLLSGGAESVAGASSQPSLLLAAALDSHGGSGTNGGNPGVVTFQGWGPVSITGAINVSGANGSAAAPGNATNGGSVSIQTTGDITCSGGVLAPGGSSRAGADGGSVVLRGKHVTFSGAVDISGGDSTTQRAGDGGLVDVVSRTPPSTVTATIDASAGVSNPVNSTNPAALPGVVTVDGLGI